jgi:hypothetical protein
MRHLEKKRSLASPAPTKRPLPLGKRNRSPGRSWPGGVRSPKRRGAPLGNTNRLTHGLYSRHISVAAEHDLDSMPIDQNQNELALARSRLAAVLEMQQSASPDRWLDYERAASHYLGVIASLIHKNAVLGRDTRTSFVTVLEMIRQVNEDQRIP